MEDTTKEFGQDLEQQGDQMLPYRGVTTGSTVIISNMLVHPGRSVKTTNKILTGISKSIVTDGDTDKDPPNLGNIKYKDISCHTNLHHLHIGNQDSSVSPPAVGLPQHDQDSSVPPPAVGLLQHDQDSREKTGDTMVPILLHSDTEDTTKEFVGLLQHDQDSNIPPPAVGLLQHDQDSREKTGDTMVPILL